MRASAVGSEVDEEELEEREVGRSEVRVEVEIGEGKRGEERREKRWFERKVMRDWRLTGLRISVWRTGRGGKAGGGGAVVSEMEGEKRYLRDRELTVF